MDRIDEEILKWIYLYQPVPVPLEERPAAVAAGPGAGSGLPPGARLAEPVRATAASAVPGARALPRNLSFNDPGDAPGAFAAAERPEAKGGAGAVQTVRRDGKKVGRNDPCPCGSGKKYKKCHGAS